MPYALLKAVHLLAVVVWVGGMFFTLFCLRPALASLEPPLRLALMRRVLARFFACVVVAAVLALGSGAWLVASASRAARGAGVGFNMPLDWHVMIVLGVVMVAIFGHVRWVLFRRLGRAIDGSDWPAGGAALAGIRRWVGVNLALGVIIIVVTRLGVTA